MINETVLRTEGFKALTERFGILDVFLNDADNFRKNSN